MNERIRELAEQARKHYPKTESSGEFWEFDEEKFAKLIVQKCVTIVALHGISNFENEDISWVCDKITKEIHEHFGVK